MKALTNTQIQELLPTLNNWVFKDKFITKTLQFNNFKEAFSAMTAIAFEAELAGHHPNWSNVYHTLVIKLQTHDAGGITPKDFELAKAIDALF